MAVRRVTSESQSLVTKLSLFSWVIIVWEFSGMLTAEAGGEAGGRVRRAIRRSTVVRGPGLKNIAHY